MKRNARRGRRSGLALAAATTLGIFLGSALIGGCTGQKLAKPAICDGKHRRSGNPYGSILPGAPIPPITAPAGPGTPVSAGGPSSGATPKTSAVASAAYPSC